MIIVTIVVIAGILAAIVVGFTSHAVTTMLVTTMNSSRPTSNPSAQAVWDTTNSYGLWASMVMMVGAIIGLLIYWGLSSQQRETVTGRYG